MGFFCFSFPPPGLRFWGVVVRKRKRGMSALLLKVTPWSFWGWGDGEEVAGVNIASFLSRYPLGPTFRIILANALIQGCQRYSR